METHFVQRRFFRQAARLGLIGVAFTAAATAWAETSRVGRQVTARSLLRGYAVQPLASETLRPADKAFLDKALASARMHARLADLGASQAVSTDVRSHAEQLKSDSRQLAEALTGLIQKKAAAGVATESEPITEAYGQLATRAGGEFDREFVRVLAALHDETITLFEQAASEAKDADVREVAAAQLPMLRAHRSRIVELKKTFD